MKNIFLKALPLSLSFTLSIAYASMSHELTVPIAEPFSQVVISDGIDLILDYGEEQTMDISYFNVNQEDIITEVKGKKLRIYMRGCKRGCKNDAYTHADVQIRLTYKDLDKLVVMGDNDVQHLNNISSNKFTLKSYGDNRISFNEIHTRKFKTSLYGDNELQIEGGEVERLKVKAFGDHKIKLSKLACVTGKVHAFGDNNINLQIHQQLNLTMFGDASIRCQGNPWVDKKIVLGDLSLEVYN